ncbi:MAG: hypothetical protein FJ395_19975 [Verrucomicrobia bacterium]|nr:hypothetical protein [Verrucomicrobiota bacterium]
MTAALHRDLKRLKALAFHRVEWAEEVLRHYHSLHEEVVQPLRPLYDWMFVPTTLWPFNIQDVLDDCRAALEKGKRLNPHLRLLIDLLPEPPSEAVCAVVAEHEHHVHKGVYENLLVTKAKYCQTELVIRTNPELRRQWQRIKATFNVQAYRDHKGVIRRTMGAERNLRPSFSVNLRRRDELFQATFDAFCLRWNLYGMQNDKPLLLKLSVNLTPYGTMIHIPAYWSFDPKRDIRWSAIAKLHRIRVPGRQGARLAEGFVQRMKDAKKLCRLDKQAARLGLKGDKKHAFLCAGLRWDPRTDDKRLARLRKEFL